MLVHAVLLAVSYILFWVVMCILAPLTVAVHEAGHALLALLLAPGRIHVELGHGERSWHRQLGRLIVTVSLQPRPAGLRGSWVYLGCRRLKPRGRTFYPPTRSYLPMILVTLGGPLASLGLAAACAALDLLTYHVLVWLVGAPSRDIVWGMQVMTVVSWLGLFGVTGLVATLQGLANLFPRRLSPAKTAELGVKGTDGWIVLYLLREALHPPVAGQRFDRFTPGMRVVLRRAQQEALERGHAHVTPDHLLLGLLRDEDSVAVAELAALGVDMARLRDAMCAAVDQTQETSTLMGLTPESKVVIEKMVDEARRFGHHHLSTEHALLGLLREGSSQAAQALVEQGVTLERLRAAIAYVHRKEEPAL